MKLVSSENKNIISKNQQTKRAIDNSKSTINSHQPYEAQRMYKQKETNHNHLSGSNISHAEHMDAHRPQPIKINFPAKLKIVQQMNGALSPTKGQSKLQNQESQLVNKNYSTHAPVTLKNLTKKIQKQSDRSPDFKANQGKFIKKPFEQILYEDKVKNQHQLVSPIRRYRYDDKNLPQPSRNLTKIQLVEKEKNFQDVQQQGCCSFNRKTYEIQVQNAGKITFC